MAVTETVLASDKLLQQGDAANDTIFGDIFFEGTTRLDDVLRGGDGNDNLNGRTGRNDLFGEGGHDALSLGNAGNDFDRAFGGKGHDTFSIEGPAGNMGVRTADQAEFIGVGACPAFQFKPELGCPLLYSCIQIAHTDSNMMESFE